jgi:spermidine synthase
MFTKDAHDNQNSYIEPSKRTWAIFIISVLGLFLEMLLIRWIGTEIRIFAYLQNTILVACFLGLGLGCFTSRQAINLRQSLISLAFLLLLMAIPITRSTIGHTSEFLNALGDMVIWGGLTNTNFMISILLVILGLALTYALLIVIVDIFVPIGRLLARLMDEHPNTIWAYSVNIAGSLMGTWLFVMMSFFYQPPFTWFVVLGGLMLIFVLWFQHDKRINLVLLVAIVILSWFAGLVPGALDVIWSPYQKLVVEEIIQQKTSSRYIVTVNNTGYQEMADLSESNTALDPNKFAPELRGLSQYDIPLLLHPNPQTFLIVGAGTGNDAAGGIRHGVKEITAVEIDPAIISIGRSLHPEKPYSSPTVQVVNDDARSFFATTSKKFDVIAFGLLDSHTTTAMTNARLDHYVYTRESITRAKALLADGGILVLTFEAQKPYIADRMARVLQETFGEDPIVFRIPRTEYGWGGVMFITGDLTSARKQIAENKRLGAFINQLQQDSPLSLPHNTKIATDDWPYIYLDAPRIPILYYLLAGLMLLILYRSSKKWKAASFITRWDRSHWHFFFLGAAFLLLEVQNISKASVVLGNTWETNAVIVSGVLVMALLANWLAHRFPRIHIGAVYAALIGISLAMYFVDLAQFAFLPYAAKAIVVGSLTTLPMLFSGIIFVQSFASAERKDDALGANMVGSLVGALIQSVTFVVGIKALLIIVAGLYLLSMLTKPHLSRRA